MSDREVLERLLINTETKRAIKAEQLQELEDQVAALREALEGMNP